jgi:hypothetical protein
MKNCPIGAVVRKILLAMMEFLFLAERFDKPQPANPAQEIAQKVFS